MGGELEHAIDFNVACYEKYCIRKERKKMYRVFEVTHNARMLDALMTVQKLQD